MSDHLSLTIAGRSIGDEHPCFVIAEAGINHNGDVALAAELEPVDGVAEAIDRIDLDRCVASSSEPEKIRSSLAQTGLLALFDGRIYSAHEVKHGKPAPDLFLHAADALGISPKHCAVVEDTIVGVQAARAAGMTAAGYCAHSSEEAMLSAGAKPFTSMAELPALLGVR
jgi:HAD superfamily hydrolase (TIGR01509 family)